MIVFLEDYEDNTNYLHYDQFAIGNERDSYELHTLGRSEGTAGDMLRPHVGMKFSTKDVDNDSSSINCARRHKGGWWYRSCYSR